MHEGGVNKVFLAPFCAQCSRSAKTSMLQMRGSYRCEKKKKKHSETEVSSVLNTKVGFLENV